MGENNSMERLGQSCSAGRAFNLMKSNKAAWRHARRRIGSVDLKGTGSRFPSFVKRACWECISGLLQVSRDGTSPSAQQF